MIETRIKTMEHATGFVGNVIAIIDMIILTFDITREQAYMYPRVVSLAHTSMAYTMALIIARKKDCIQEAIMDMNKSIPMPGRQ